MESAGVTLVKGDLRAIARARRLSRATMRNIRQNLFFAFIYNVPACRWRLACCIRSLDSDQSDLGQRGHEPQFAVGGWQRLAAAAGETLVSAGHGVSASHTFRRNCP